MKYYFICKKLLGQREFDNFISKLTEKIIIRFSSSIILDRYIDILEANIKLIIIISLCNVLNFSEDEKKEKINLNLFKGKLIVNDVIKFEEENKFYINKIVELLS